MTKEEFNLAENGSSEIDLEDSLSTKAKPSFLIEYAEDGIYLTLFRGGEELDLMSIFEIVGKYGIEKFSFLDIKNGFSKNEEIPFKIAPAQEKKALKDGFIAYMSTDKMKAFLIIFDENERSTESIVAELADTFKVGVEFSSIDYLIKNKIHNEPVLFAEGIVPIDGESGYVDYKFNIEDKSGPEIKKDGSADFKELHLLNNIEAKTVLAELVAPVKGEDGINVLGETVAFKPGKEACFKYGKNITEIEDGKFLVSEVDGHVKLEGGKLNVYEVYEVRGNVDNSIGNIDFKGSVKVYGDVLTGFTVKCNGDLEICGVVESSRLESEGSILIKSGISGNNACEVKAKGSVIAKYIESAYVFSGKLIESEMILHSDIVSRGDIIASGKKGAIMGGRARAKDNIRAKFIGAVMATPTLIETGIDPRLKMEKENLQKDIDRLDRDIYKLEKIIGYLDQWYKSGKLDKEKRDMYESAVKTKAEFESLFSEAEQNLESFNWEESKIRGRVISEGIIYPGVRIVIGSRIYQVDEEINHSTIYKDHLNGEITIGPFLEKTDK